MANQYNQRFIIKTCEVNEIVVVHVPTKDRSVLDYSCLYARILSIPHPDRYQLQTKHGILNHCFTPSQLNPVSPLLGMFILYYTYR